MNGVHDLGGMDNLGTIEREVDEPVFHADWERSMFASAIALLGAGYFELDEVRRSVEWMPPADYLDAAYYETWLFGICSLLEEKGLATAAELESGHPIPGAGSAPPPAPPLSREFAEYMMNNPVPASVDADVAPRFRVGDRVLTRNINPRAHTRLPRYARAKHGVIEQDHGVFPLPDANAHGAPPRPQHCYSVRFEARELWGEDAPAGDAVYIDLFDEYMESAR